MCLVYWLILILWSELCFYLNSVAWVAIMPMGPAKRTRVPDDKVYHTLLELTEARGREIREFLIPHPLIVNVWQICGVPGWAWQKAASNSLNVIIKKVMQKVWLIQLSAESLTEKLPHSSNHKMLLREIYFWDVGFARRSYASTSLKDKPVGGTKIGPTGCGSLGSVHKPKINF